MFSMTPILMRRYSVHSELGVGLVASSFALGRFCTTSLWPILSDFIGRKKVLFIALMGGAAGSALQGVAIAYTWPFWAFLTVRGVAGMFSGIVPTVKAYIVDTFRSEDVPKVLAYREAAGTGAFILGPALGGFLAARFLSAPMFFSALASSGAALLCLHVLPEPRTPPIAKAKSQTAGESRWQPWRAVPLFFLSFIWACSRTCFHSYFPLLLARRFALPLARLGAVLTAISFLVAMVQIGVFERCRRRYGLEKTVLLGYLLVVIGLGSLVTWPDSSSLPQIFASAAVYGAGSALVSPALPALLVRFAPKGRTGAILGIDSAIVNFGRIVAPSLFGVFLFSDYAKLCLGPARVATAAGLVAFVLAAKEGRAAEGADGTKRSG